METLTIGAARLGICLTPEQAAQFQTYFEELIAWNQKVNLTAVTEYEDVQEKHFLDSLWVARVLRDRGWDLTLPKRAIDVGTGAGLPGLALKIAFPDLGLTLLDSIAKKTAFLRHLVCRLGLQRVEVITARAEELARRESYREGYDLALARGVAALPALVEICLPFVKVGGMLVAHKGAQVREEVSQARHALELLGGRLGAVQGQESEGRALVIIDKVAPSPPAYPRRAGVPQRRPL